jgi:hypothetical protein
MTSNLPSTLRTKKNNQVSPLGDSFSLRFNYDVACERHIREGVKSGIINGIITVSEITGEREVVCMLFGQKSLKGFFFFAEQSRGLDSVIVEDLSLPSFPQQHAIAS